MNKSLRNLLLKKTPLLTFVFSLLPTWLIYTWIMNAVSIKTKNALGDVITEAGEMITKVEARMIELARGRVRRDELEGFREILSLGKKGLLNPNRYLVGVYDGKLPQSFRELEELEGKVDFRFPIISFYQAWGDRKEHQFPRKFVETISELGSVPMITWEPWVTEFEGEKRPHLLPLPERQEGSLSAIAQGVYDFYVLAWAEAARDFGRPFFLRFAHEMNNVYRYPWSPQYGNKPEDYVRAWCHLHSLFQEVGANNVIWVWSPHASREDFMQYYPGDDVVDWVATGILNYGTAAEWSRWWSFDQLLAPSYKQLAQLGKPIMIAELGCLTAGGDQAIWYKNALESLSERYPLIKAIVLFHQRNDYTLTQERLDWGILDKSETSRIIREWLDSR